MDSTLLDASCCSATVFKGMCPPLRGIRIILSTMNENRLIGRVVQIRE